MFMVKSIFTEANVARIEFEVSEEVLPRRNFFACSIHELGLVSGESFLIGEKNAIPLCCWIK